MRLNRADSCAGRIEVVLFATDHVNAKALVRRSGIVKAGDILTDVLRVLEYGMSQIKSLSHWTQVLFVIRAPHHKHRGHASKISSVTEESEPVRRSRMFSKETSA